MQEEDNLLEHLQKVENDASAIITQAQKEAHSKISDAHAKAQNEFKINCNNLNESLENEFNQNCSLAKESFQKKIEEYKSEIKNALKWTQ